MDDDYRWTQAGGVDWLVTPPIPGQDHAMAGVIIGYGRADQAMDRLGIADLFAAALRRELARPVDSSGAPPAEVITRLGATSLAIIFRGRPDDVEVAVRRLPAILADPEPLSVDDALRRRVAAGAAEADPLTGWEEAIAARYGAGPLALSTWQLPALPTILEAEVRALAYRLRPGADSVPAVGFTDDPFLLGVGWPAGHSVPRPALPRCDVALPAVIGTQQPFQLLSAVTGGDAAGIVAGYATAVTVQRRLAALDEQEAGVVGRAHWIGPELLLTLDRTRSPSPPDVTAEALEALDIVSELYPEGIDSLRREVVDAGAERTPGSTIALAMRRLADGTRSTPDARRAELERLTVEEIRTELARLRASVVLQIPAGSSAPAGFTVWRPPLPAPRGRRYVAAMPVGRWRAPREVLRSDGDLLYRTLDVNGHRAFHGVDLGHLALRLDRAEDRTLLIDDRFRVIDIAWPLHRGRGLRNLVDRATATVATTPMPVDGTDHLMLARATTRWRRNRWIALAAVIVAVALGIVGIVRPGAVTTGTPRQTGTHVTAAMGEPARLANGTMITVSDPARRSFQGQRLITAEVRFCAGGPTNQGGGDDQARDYIGPEKFSLVAGDGTQSGVGPFSGDSRAPLTAIQLDDGECAEGTISFTVPTSGAAQIRYHNVVDDDVRWTVPS